MRYSITITMMLLAQGCFLPGAINKLPDEARPATSAEIGIANDVLLDVDRDPRFPDSTRGCVRKTSEWYVAVVDADTWDRYCWAPPGQRTTCLREAPWGYHSVRRRKYDAPLIVHYEAHPRVPIRHEFGHVIRGCMGLHSDLGHTDDAYWRLIDGGGR